MAKHVSDSDVNVSSTPSTSPKVSPTRVFFLDVTSLPALSHSQSRSLVIPARSETWQGCIKDRFQGLPSGCDQALLVTSLEASVFTVDGKTLRQDHPVRALTDATIRMRLPGLRGGGRGQVSDGGQVADQENELGQSSAATAALRGGSAKRKVIDLDDKEKRRARETTRRNTESTKAKATAKRSTIAAKAKAKEREKLQMHTSRMRGRKLRPGGARLQPRRRQKTEQIQMHTGRMLRPGGARLQPRQRQHHIGKAMHIRDVIAPTKERLRTWRQMLSARPSGG